MRDEYPALSKAELELIVKAARGEVADFSSADSSENDPARGSGWPKVRTISAGVLHALATGKNPAWPIHAKGIRVKGAKICGNIDFESAKILSRLALVRCHIGQQVLIKDASIPSIDLSGSFVARGIDGNGLRVEHDVVLGTGFVAEGEVRLEGAQIGGDLHCDGGLFKCLSPDAFSADGIDVKGDVSLAFGFRAIGEVRLVGAQIAGDLNCRGGMFSNPPRVGRDGKLVETSGDALSAHRVNVKGKVFLDARDNKTRFQAQGCVQLIGAKIGDDLRCSGGFFKNPPVQGRDGKDLETTGNALNADRVSVKGSIFLDTNSDNVGFHAEGTVRLNEAQIGDDLKCTGGAFIRRKGTSFEANGLDVKGSIYLNQGFHSEGVVDLLGAQVGGYFQCGGGSFINPGWYALAASRINVKSDVLLRYGFHSNGGVALTGAQIGGNLECEGGEFENPPEMGSDGKIIPGTGVALIAPRAEVKGNVFLENGFSAQGRVVLTGAQVGGDLNCSGGSFTILEAERATIKGLFVWQLIVRHENIQLHLANALAASLLDDGEASWPARGNLDLDGFVYGRIAQGPPGAERPPLAESRLTWLLCQYDIDWLTKGIPFKPQPYRQLARVLAENGDQYGSIRVLEQMESLRRQREDVTLRARFRSLLLSTIDYGYEPGLAVWMIGGLSMLGWILYRRAHLAGTIVPKDKDAYPPFKSTGRPPTHYERFAPLTYSVENSLPLVNLGQTDRWGPDPNPQWIGVSVRGLGSRHAWPRYVDWLRRLLVKVGLEPEICEFVPRPWLARFATSPRFMRWFFWFQILLGWLLATLFLAGVTGIVHKD